MYKDEIIKIKEQINKLEEIYINNKTQRENLTKEIESLDKELVKLEKILNTSNRQSTSSYYVECNTVKQTNRQYIKFCIERCTKRISFFTILSIIANLIFNKGVIVLNNILFISIVNLALEIQTYLQLREKKPKNRKISQRKLEKIKREYQKIKEKRLTAGQKYKSYWELEKTSYNTYKITKQLLTEKIDSIDILQDSYNVTNNTIKLNDIYYRITLDENTYFESTMNKKILFDEQLKKYLIEKISEISCNISKSGYLNKLTTEELVAILANYIPKNKHNDTLCHIIHAILGFAGNMQLRSIVWYEDRDENLINNPMITYDEEGRWNELKTHRNTDYIELFNKLYDNFFYIFMSEQKVKTRTKK